jgi:hypothetical protein
MISSSAVALHLNQPVPKRVDGFTCRPVQRAAQHDVNIPLYSESYHLGHFRRRQVAPFFRPIPMATSGGRINFSFLKSTKLRGGQKCV